MSILKISRFAHLTLAICLVATASILSVVRFWLLPQATEWRDELRSSISVMVGEAVQFKSLSAGMRGFRPELTVRGFRIENSAHDGPPLEFERLGVGLDVTGTLVSGKPVVNFIELSGAKVRLSRRPGSVVSVLGLKPGDVPLWLFAEGEVRFSDIDLEWDAGNDGQPMALGRAQIRLRNAGAQHRVDGRVDLPGKLGKMVKGSAEIEGNPLGSEEWHGKAYVEAKRLREGAFVESLPVRMRSGEAGMQVWAEWNAGVLSEVAGRLDLDRPVFTWHGDDGAEGMLNLDKLAGWLFWHKQDNGWRLDAKRLSLSHRGRAWPETDFAIAVGNAPDNSMQSFRAAINYLRLDDAEALLGAGLPLFDLNVRETLRAFSPKGEVRDGRLVYQADGHFGFCGQLAGIAFNPPEGWMSIGRLNGRLCGTDRNGSIEFNTAKPELKLTALWQKPIAPDMFSGSFQWRRTGGADLPTFQTPVEMDKLFAGSAWRIVGNQVELVAPGLQASAGFALDLPAGEGESPVIDMNAQLREVDAARLREYLPFGVMSPNASKWLGEAFDGGKFKTANVLLRGRLADFPYPQGEGLFDAQIESENMELDFNPAWPHLYDINAKIHFLGSSLFIDAETGRIGNVPFHAVHAETADYTGNGWLGLHGSLDSDLLSAMKFLRQTPVRFIPERLSKVAESAGQFHLDLNLMLPMSFGMGDVGFGGLLQLNNASLALKGINLKVQDIGGALSFTGNGIEGRQLFANVMDEPILVDVGQQHGDILFDILGKTSVMALRKVFPGDYWKHAEGDFSYHLNLQIPESLDSSSKPMRITLSTDLAGLELKLPAPLVKPAADKKEFKADMALRRGDHLSLHLAYGTEGRARLLFSGSEGLSLESGDVAWEKPQPPASGDTGLGLFLKMGHFDMGEWRTLLKEFGAGPVKAMPRELDIQIGKLSWDGEDLGPFFLTGKREVGELFGEVDSYYGKGSYRAAFPEFSHALLRLDFERLNFPKFLEGKEGQPPTASPDPAALPALQISARHLLRQGIDLGALELEAEHWTSGLNIKRLSLNSDNHEIGLKGSWMRQEGRDETKLEGRLRVNDLDFFLNLLGYGKEIYRTPTDASFSLGWDGAPQQFSPASVAGGVRLKMGRGRVLPMEPGLGRALGMLNLQTLRRLLLIDFSNLFGSGLAYDSMEGVFHLRGGQAKTDGFMIDAVAAEILVMGRVGLVSHDLEQTISVAPRGRASTPQAGAAVGAVIDMAHRLMGADDVNLARTNYAVTGSWDDPQFKHIEGNVSLEMIDRAWSDFKAMSGVGGKGDNVSE
ncbi:MAG: YhdP family protein [Proteobacteria bacterium]|nr:YhdP family protein [Pseudomonadota bacterium]